ncbi:glycosyltransferase, partial [Methylomonas rivi]
MINRTEQDIMKDWSTKEPPLVSVCCTTFNHENYISDAIDGFLMQDTDFPFEIIIRDDCSTDKTTDIISEYVKKFPNLIKPIYETENQFSKGVKPMPVVFKKAAGKYFALCEGDDYWLNNNKLSIQVNELENNAHINITFHPAYSDSSLVQNECSIVCQHSLTKHIFSPSESIEGGGEFCPTCSLVFRKSVFDNLPEWFYLAPVGDMYIQYIGSLPNGILFLPEPMSFYRTQGTVNWTSKLKDKRNLVKHSIKTINSLNDFNIWSDYKYEPSVLKVINAYTALLFFETTSKAK